MAGKAGAAGQGAGPLLKKALARHRKGQYADAEALYPRVLKREPDNFDALQLLGAVLLARGRYAGAERRLQAALQRDAGKADVWCNLGLARRALGQPEAAMAAFERALHLQPECYQMAQKFQFGLQHQLQAKQWKYPLNLRVQNMLTMI